MKIVKIVCFSVLGLAVIGALGNRSHSNTPDASPGTPNADGAVSGAHNGTGTDPPYNPGIEQPAPTRHALQASDDSADFCNAIHAKIKGSGLPEAAGALATSGKTYSRTGEALPLLVDIAYFGAIARNTTAELQTIPRPADVSSTIVNDYANLDVNLQATSVIAADTTTADDLPNFLAAEKLLLAAMNTFNADSAAVTS
jgi:hypothetical protein